VVYCAVLCSRVYCHESYCIAVWCVVLNCIAWQWREVEYVAVRCYVSIMNAMPSAQCGLISLVNLTSP
jgi:hypothetical protein